MENENANKKTSFGIYFLEVAMIFGAYEIFGIVPGLIGILTGYFTKRAFENTNQELWKTWAVSIGIGLATAFLLSLLLGSLFAKA